MQKLYTTAGETLPGIPWNIYPRPQMVRKEWLCLNGKWHFECGEIRTEIYVPFCPESLLSGQNLQMEYGMKMKYSRSFTLPKEWNGRRILLHFGGVSRMAEVCVNGKKTVTHEESYLPFSAQTARHPSAARSVRYTNRPFVAHWLNWLNILANNRPKAKSS